MIVFVQDIKEGDRFHSRRAPDTGWVAIEDAETNRLGEVSVRVQHVPGRGISDRFWSHDDEIEVQRY